MDFSTQTQATVAIEVGRIQAEFDRLSGEELAAKVAGDFFNQTRLDLLKSMEVYGGTLKQFFCGRLSGGAQSKNEERMIALFGLSTDEELDQFYSKIEAIQAYACKCQ